MHPTFPGEVCPIMIASRVDATDARNRAITFQHEIEPFIDEYSARCERHKSCLSPQGDIVDFHRRHRQLIASTLFLACANLSRHPLPCSVYPARLLRELVRDVTGRPVDTPSTNLLARVRAAAPHDWAAFAQSMHDLSLGPSGSSSWPARETAANTLRALEALRPTWSRIAAEVERKHGKDSWVRKDPAHRRAHGWLDLCTWLLSGLASTPDGPLRLFVDYLFGLLRHFDVCAGPSRAACDVLVLEVFAVVYSYADARGLEVVEPRLTLGSHGHDGCGLRKRVQRARLNSLLRGRPRARPLVSDELWLAWLRPRLASLAGRASGC